MKKIKCPICQKELEQDSIQCPYCKYRFKIVPKRVNSPEDNKMRLDGYLVSDIRDCLVHTEEDTLERFRKAQNKPEFNPSAGFGGNLWFAKRGMFDISLWLIVLNMTAVPLMAAAYGWMHKGSRSLPYDTGYVFLFLLIMLALEFYPLGKIADRMFWKNKYISTVLFKYSILGYLILILPIILPSLPSLMSVICIATTIKSGVMPMFL